MIACDNCWRGI